jgi:AbrB family looped-hinge helix DNA binding protein
MEAAIRDKKPKAIHYKRQPKPAAQALVTDRAGKGPIKAAASEIYIVRVDERGRVTLPARARKALGVQPGTTFYIEKDESGFRLAKSENPFDGLAQYAIAEDAAGRTRDLREYARERGIDLGGE